MKNSSLDNTIYMKSHLSFTGGPPGEAPVLEENLLSANSGAGVGVCAVSAFKPVSISGRGAAGETSGQPSVGPPLPAGCWSCGCSSCCLTCGGATVPTAATTMYREGQRLVVVVVLLGGVRARRPWAAFLPQVLVLLADPIQLALQFLDAATLSLQELGLALNDVVELQEVLHCPVGALWAGLHGGCPASRGISTTTSHHHGFDPVGPRSTPPTSPDEWGGGRDRQRLRWLTMGFRCSETGSHRD